jgi:hypothetical protein
MRVVDPMGAWCQLASALNLDDLIAVGDGLLAGRLPLATSEGINARVLENVASWGEAAA